MNFFKRLGDNRRGYPSDIQFPNAVWQCIACKKHFPPRTRKDLYPDYFIIPDEPGTLITQSGKGTCMDCARKHRDRAGTTSPKGEPLYLLSVKQLWNEIDDPPEYLFKSNKTKAREFAERYTIQAGKLIANPSTQHGAIYGLERAIEIDPTYFVPWVILIDLHYYLENDEEYHKIADNGLKHFPRSGMFYVFRGVGMFNMATQLKDTHKKISMMQSGLIDVTSGIALGPSPELLAIPGRDKKLIEVNWMQMQMTMRNTLGEAQYARVMQQMNIERLVSNSSIERELNDIKRRLR